MLPPALKAQRSLLRRRHATLPSDGTRERKNPLQKCLDAQVRRAAAATTDAAVPFAGLPRRRMPRHHVAHPRQCEKPRYTRINATPALRHGARSAPSVAGTRMLRDAPAYALRIGRRVCQRESV